VDMYSQAGERDRTAHTSTELCTATAYTARSGGRQALTRSTQVMVLLCLLLAFACMHKGGGLNLLLM
jgi:hypothetical protein